MPKGPGYKQVYYKDVPSGTKITEGKNSYKIPLSDRTCQVPSNSKIPSAKTPTPISYSNKGEVQTKIKK